MNEKHNPGDHVYCVINPAITGKIIKRDCYHGVYLYGLKVEDEDSFIKHFGLGSTSVIFLHWQLKRT